MKKKQQQYINKTSNKPRGSLTYLSLMLIQSYIDLHLENCHMEQIQHAATQNQLPHELQSIPIALKNYVYLYQNGCRNY